MYKLSSYDFLCLLLKFIFQIMKIFNLNNNVLIKKHVFIKNKKKRKEMHESRKGVLIEDVYFLSFN